MKPNILLIASLLLLLFSGLTAIGQTIETKADNLAFNEYNPNVDNMLNVINLAGFLISQVIDLDKDDAKTEKERKKTPFKEALDKYSINYINANFEIPQDQVQAFISYVENEGVDETLLESDQEMKLLERITQLSKSFLQSQSEKD